MSPEQLWPTGGVQLSRFLCRFLCGFLQKKRNHLETPKAAGWNQTGPLWFLNGLKDH